MFLTVASIVCKFKVNGTMAPLLGHGRKIKLSRPYNQISKEADGVSDLQQD